MKVSRFLSVVGFITCVALIYVFMQTEIVRLAYACQKNQMRLQELLDKNTFLRYNIDKNASLIRIGDKLSDQADFHMPEAYRYVKLQCPAALVKEGGQQQKKPNIVLRLFGITREAEAKTINR